MQTLGPPRRQRPRQVHLYVIIIQLNVLSECLLVLSDAKSSGDQVLQLSASSDAWPWRRPCLIVVPKNVNSVAVVIKDGDGGAGKNRERHETASSALLRCRYGETKGGATKRPRRRRRRWRFAEQDIKWLGRCDAGATWAWRSEQSSSLKVDRGRRQRRRRRRSGDDARFVIEVTDSDGDGDGGSVGGADHRMLELRYSTADTNAVQQRQQPRDIAATRTTCDGRPLSPARLSARSGGFLLGGEDGQCAVAVHLGHAYKVRLAFFPSAAETQGELMMTSVLFDLQQNFLLDG